MRFLRATTAEVHARRAICDSCGCHGVHVDSYLCDTGYFAAARIIDDYPEGVEVRVDHETLLLVDENGHLICDCCAEVAV